jgi:hypothetical protein
LPTTLFLFTNETLPKKYEQSEKKSCAHLFLTGSTKPSLLPNDDQTMLELIKIKKQIVSFGKFHRTLAQRTSWQNSHSFLPLYRILEKQKKICCQLPTYFYQISATYINQQVGGLLTSSAKRYF